MQELTLLASRESGLLARWLANEQRSSPALVGGLYRQIYDKLHFGLRRSQVEAEDAAQEVFLELVRKRLEIRKSPRDYAHGVARMKLLQRICSRHRRERMVSTPDFEDVTAEAPSTPDLIDRARDAVRLVATLQELSIEHQQCLALVYGRELKNVEAATALGLGVIELNNRLRSARCCLRKGLVRTRGSDSGPSRCSLSFGQWVERVLGPAAERVQAPTERGPRR